MVDTYTIKDEVVNIQNTLLKNSIAKKTNIELLNSEAAIRDLYAEYAQKIKDVGTKLFKMQDHVVESKTLITKEYFDNVFQDVYNDLKTLYTYVKYTDDLISINLDTNIKFFSTLEKRIISLENKLDVARMNVNSMLSVDKVFFEGFSNKAIENQYDNVLLDKKTGHLTLNPIEIKHHNQRYNIKSVSSETIPVHNTSGGVIDTTSVLNTFDESYRRDGSNDMLENGLWKKEVYCNDIPDLQLVINKQSFDNKIIYNTQGLISFVDIEFENIIDMNALSIDLFGEYETTILGIFSKTKDSEEWVPLEKLHKKVVGNDELLVDSFGERSAFNILTYRNLELRDIRFLRVVFNQKNFTVIESSETDLSNTEAKIKKDLEERRYELIKLDGGSDSKPAKPKSFNYDSFYAKLSNIVEHSNSVDQMIADIINTFEPKPKFRTINFNSYLKYELGAWSIEPKTLKFSGIGKFKSADYNFSEKAMVSAALITNQEDIKENTCNWFISDSLTNNMIPIIPNDEIIRKEPINVVTDYYYQEIMGWNKGTIIQLDFPINTALIATISIIEDGRHIYLNDTKFIFFNSSLLYIEDITDYRKHKYVIKYIPAKFETVNIYTIYSNDKKSTTDIDIIPYTVASPRRSTLQLFLDQLDLKDTYTITRTKCTVAEYKSYFNNIYNLIIASSTYDQLSIEQQDKINKYLHINKIMGYVDMTHDEFINGTIGNENTIGDLVLVSSIPKYFERKLI